MHELAADTAAGSPKPSSGPPRKASRGWAASVQSRESRVRLPW